MLKLIGCLMVTGATTLAGMKRASDIREGYRQMQDIQRLMYQLQGEIRYARDCLGEIFSHIGRRSEQPYQRWLLALSGRMEQREHGVFAQMWEEGIREDLGGLKLPEKEMDRLKALGGQLGNMDVQMQIRTLDLYQEQLVQSMEEMRGEMRTKVRLCHCLGVMGGMLIAVLLL